MFQSCEMFALGVIGLLVENVHKWRLQGAFKCGILILEF